MVHIKLLLPRMLVDFKEATDTVFFLAGPIKGANDWQKDAINLLQKYAHTLHDGGNIYVVCPSIYKPSHELYSLKTIGIIKENFTKKQKNITASRTDWERHHLEIASRLGCIIFWLGKEDEKNPRKREDGPYARDTYGELGEWRARMSYERKYGHTQINLVIGAHPDFHGLAQIERNFKRMVGEDFIISNTLDETIKRATTVERVKKLKSMRPFLVGVAGPSGAGKSTVTKLIEAERQNVLRINLDNYFNDVGGFSKVNGLLNWDLPNNLNYELLLENLKDLKEGKSTKIPLFDKVTFERTYKTIEPKEIVLVEGFLLYFDKKVRDLFDKKIYIDVSDQTQLIRRARRETPERIRYIQEVVIPSYKIFGLPTQKYADVVFRGDKTPEELKSEILEYVFTQI